MTDAFLSSVAYGRWGQRRQQNTCVRIINYRDSYFNRFLFYDSPCLVSGTHVTLRQAVTIDMKAGILGR